MNSRVKNLLFWVVVGLFMILLFNLFSVPTHAPEEEVIFSDFMAKLDKGDFEKVVIKGNHISGVLKDKTRIRTYSADYPDKVINDRGEEFTIDYRLNLEGSQWKVYDVVTENISMLTTTARSLAAFLAGLLSRNCCERFATRSISQTNNPLGGHHVFAYPIDTACTWRISSIHRRQLERFAGTRPELYSNSQMSNREIERYAPIDSQSMDVLQHAIERMGLSARAYHRIRKIARTIADIENSEVIGLPHVVEAVQYRTLDRVREFVGDEVGYLPLASVLTLVEKAPNRIGCFIEALFQSGARISALLNIKLTDCTIDTEKGYVYIRIVDKCDIERKVNMTLTLYNRICTTFRGQKYLFETFEGNQYTREYVSREIHEVGKALKVQANCHILRHSLAMYLKALGFSADEIARTMGHQDELTTLKYYFHGTISAEQQLGALKQFKSP